MHTHLTVQNTHHARAWRRHQGGGNSRRKSTYPRVALESFQRSAAAPTAPPSRPQRGARGRGERHVGCFSSQTLFSKRMVGSKIETLILNIPTSPANENAAVCTPLDRDSPSATTHSIPQNFNIHTRYKPSPESPTSMSEIGKLVSLKSTIYNLIKSEI
jgi:hypothetical protein